MSVVSLRGLRLAGKVGYVPIVARRSSTKQQEAPEIEVVTTSIENVLSEREVERICNKSRLNHGHRNLVNGRQPYNEPVHRFHNTVKFKRRMYGRYGETSNVYPGLAWPTAEDLEDQREYERVAYPLTIQQMQQNALNRLDAERQEIEVRQQKIDDNMRKLNSWLKEVRDKAEKKTLEAQLVKEKKERLIEEVKKHFGYKIDPKDDRFKEMLAKREKEEKKKSRDEKKKLREEKLLKYLKTANE